MNKYKEIFNELNIDDIRYGESMKEHTTFKIGGPADVMILPKTEKEILDVIKFCRKKEIDFMVMGNGSNLLVRDGGVRGVVIKINENYNKIRRCGNKIYCQAGATMTAASRFAMREELTGLEFCNGIPGTIGGAATMNAGAYGGETKNVMTRVKVIDKDNNIKIYNNEDMNFRYRGSRVEDEGLIVLEAEYTLEEGIFKEIKKTMDDLTERRTSKQPLELPSGGSTFKRPEGYYAGKLIEDSGLKGLTHGGVQVSKKHSGFVVNHDNGTCQDVLNLVSTIQKVIRDEHGVEMETEIKIIGEDL